jgi:hypothetical protein
LGKNHACRVAQKLAQLPMKLRSAFERMETIAEGRGIREYARLVERFGGRSWKKRKGIAAVEVDGIVGRAEIHWYECHGVGKVKMKVKRWL